MQLIMHDSIVLNKLFVELLCDIDIQQIETQTHQNIIRKSKIFPSIQWLPSTHRIFTNRRREAKHCFTYTIT